MSIVRGLVTGVALCAVIVLAAGAEEMKDKARAEAPKELKSQTHCPVMGGVIDSTVFTDIQGQRVYHCCPGCSEQLKKDPDKYFKKAAAEGVLFENIQTNCPVSGKELENKSVYTDFEGRRVAFCCEGCIGPFMENPQKYLEKLDARPESQEVQDQKGQKEHDHGSHDHSGQNHSGQSSCGHDNCSHHQ